MKWTVIIFVVYLGCSFGSSWRLGGLNLLSTFHLANLRRDVKEQSLILNEGIKTTGCTIFSRASPLVPLGKVSTSGHFVSGSTIRGCHGNSM